MASIQNLLDLGCQWPMPAAGWPRGEPFCTPEARCPSGGSYTFQNGMFQCSHHATWDVPVPLPPVDGSPVADLMESVDALEAEVAVLEDGILTRLVIASSQAGPQ